MKLFKHYKNKPYKLLGEVKHSETLEDLVLYETRYKNENAKVWVRPKKMFFESVELNGKTIPRFEKIDLKIIGTNSITEKEIGQIGLIMKKAFGEWHQNSFQSTFDNHKNFYLLTAFIEAEPVGFKIGYQLNSEEFYSWLGGVVPEYRGVGIATDLMKAQHEWCNVRGFKKIRTKTQNHFREMLLLNIRCGFNVVGFHHSDPDGTKIVMEKVL